MTVKSLISLALFGAALGVMPRIATAATIFQFQFDDAGGLTADGAIGSPIVGTGTFTSPVDLTVGTYQLSELTGYTFAFQFAGNSFSTADEATDPGDVGLVVSAIPDGLRLIFTEYGLDGDSGPQGGSIDFDNELGGLSFSPSYDGDDLYAQTPGFTFGNYLATATPEPATWAMMLVGFGVIGVAARRRKLGFSR